MEIHEILSHDFFCANSNFFREIKTAKIYLVKMAKIELQNRIFQEFRAKVEVTRDAGGCSKLSMHG